MNAPENAAPEPADGPAPAPAGRTNPRLTANLNADYEAIRNDLEQAQELAADFQRQVADKSNEVAHIKTLLQKTKTDLERLEGHVAELRQERHRLANELMIASAMELELARTKRERDQVRKDLEEVRDQASARIMELQAEVIQQRTEIRRLESLDKQPVAAVSVGPSSTSEPAMEKINELTATVARLMSIVEARDDSSKTSPASRKAGGDVAEEVFIDIPFER